MAPAARTVTMEAQRVVIRGRVQGVGFRDAAVQAAFEIGVQGWVRNRRDGSVEAHVQGDSAAIELFTAWCRHGPPLARVSALVIAPADLDPVLTAFELRATA